jgi:hypothetical protein
MEGYSRRKKDRKAGEPETNPKMEERQETRDGNDKGVDVANIVQELKRSIERTQFDMQHHLQESQEHLSRGQHEMKTTLSNIHTSLEAGQDRIAQLLMQMVHGKEAPVIAQFVVFGGAVNRIPGNNRDTPRPYMPSVLDT